MYAEVQARPISWRPLAVPAEHGGWGFVLEPVLLAMLVAPSWRGALVGLAALCAFLARHPLKLALQDTVRGKSYPRTRACWILAGAYLFAAAMSLAFLDLRVLIPLGLVAPLAITQVLHDAYGRGRELLPEMSGVAAMSSIAAAVAIAGGMRIVPAFVLAGIVLARSLPSLVFVRALIHRSPRWPAVVMHAIAVAAVASFAPPLAVVAMVLLLARSMLTQPQRAQSIGWKEVVWGVVTVVLAAVSLTVNR